MQIINESISKELISIIIPVYNVERYLEKCLNSIIKQTYTNFEAILIDDGSTDMSLNICNEFARRDKRFVVLSQKNKGVSAARNKGLLLSKGDYITFVDSDDSIHKDYLSVLYNNIVFAKADLSICKWTRSDKSERHSDKTIRVWNQEETFYQYFQNHLIDGNVYAKLYKKACIMDTEFDERLKIGEDQIFVIQILEHCQKVVFQNLPLYTYLIRNTSAMNTLLDSRYWDSVYRAEWLVNEANQNLPHLKGLFRKEEINIYVIMMVRHIKEGTCESQKIINVIYPRIKQSKCIEFYQYSGLFEFLRYFVIKYFLPFAKVIIRIKQLKNKGRRE